MKIVDIIVIVILLLYLLKGFKNGVIKETISLVGSIAVILIAIKLKDPVSIYLYEHAPFFSFGGIFSGIGVINILLYETIAFILCMAVLLIVFKVVMGVTNIIDKLLKLTIILEIPSKILGAVIGFVEGVIFVFFALLICKNIEVTNEYINESKYVNKIVSDTPLLSKVTAPISEAREEIYVIANNYKDDKETANLYAFDSLLKHKIINPASAQKLIDNGKLKINGADVILDKYN